MAAGACQWSGAVMRTPSTSFALEDAPEVFFRLRGIRLGGRHRLHALGEGLLVGIANEADLDARHAAEHLRVLRAAAVGADDGEDDAIVGALGVKMRGSGYAEPDGGGRRGLDERTP